MSTLTNSVEYSVDLEDALFWGISLWSALW